MASTYSTNLGIELPGTGDQAGVWGNTTNTNLGTLIEQAISGYVTQAVATGTDTTITIPNGATGVARNMYLELTGTGGASTNLIVPANKKLYFIFNNTSSGQVTVKVSGQTGISVPNGKKMVLVSNGTDIVTAENYVASLSSDNLTLTGSLSVGTTSAFTGVATFTANPVLNGGTANGVLYLNGSKVATSGSVLTFDGTNFNIGGSGSGSRFVVRGTGTTSATFSIEATTSGGATRFLVADDGLCRWYGTSNAETMRLDNAGNLGIGTASPSTKLQVIGNTKVGTGAASNSATFMVNNLNASATGIQLFQDGQESWIMGLPASSTALTWANSGSEKMRLDTVGNVGIGTTSPLQKLHVATAGNNYIVSHNTAGSTSALLLGAESGLNAIYSWTTVAGSTGRPLAFYTGPSEAMRLDTSGNLGIGTASPNNKLQSSYSAPVSVPAAGAGGHGVAVGSAGYGLVGGALSSGNAYLQATRWDGSAINYDMVLQPNGGNLGLGVTPSASWFASAKAMQIGSSGAPYMGLAQQTTTTCDGYMLWGARLSGDRAFQYITTGDAVCAYRQNAGTHNWFTAASGTAGNPITFTQAMTLDSSGNLGIGTASPANYANYRNLAISGTTGANIDMLSGSTKVGNLFNDGTNFYAYNVIAGALVFGTNNAERARFDSSGNLGIGTASPSEKLTVAGNIKLGTSGTTYVYGPATTGRSFISNSDSTAYIGIYGSAYGAGSNSIISFVAGTTNSMTYDSSGNLGLGVTPSAWSGRTAIQLPDNAYVVSSGPTVLLGANVYFNGVNRTYISNGVATDYRQINGEHRWEYAASGTAGNTISFTQAMTLNSSGQLSVGTTSANYRLRVASADNSGSTVISRFESANEAQAVQIRFASVLGDGGDFTTGTSTNHNTIFATNNTERGRFTSGGDLLIGKTGTNLAAAGVELRGGNSDSYFTVTNATSVMAVNRESTDGDLIRFFQGAASIEGSISVSGATVSYNAFAGSHWSQLQDGSRPDILRGTVMESINELCVWPGESNERLPKAKISDTSGSKKVYGVFMTWEPNWDTTNDMLITSVGAFICRVNGSVTVQEGDLLESNGDGTARVQADDIIRSSTIGKVTSTVKTHEYDDGSYCVPTVLYCG